MGERESKRGGTRVKKTPLYHLTFVYFGEKVREREKEGGRRGEREKGRVKARGREGVLEYKRLNY